MTLTATPPEARAARAAPAPADDPLSRMLSERDWLLADGATGTTLFNMGLQSGDAPELWNVDHPDRVEALYRGAVDAGSDLFLTNTFGGTAARLKLHEAQSRVHELNARGAEIGRRVADGSGRPVVVAGSMGPTGEILQPLGPLSEDEATAMFLAQAEGLRAGGADVLWVETISAPEEARAAAAAADAAGMPWVLTMSFDTAGRTMMGLTAKDFGALARRFPRQPVAIGANCGTGASDLLRTILGLAGATDLPIVAKGNAGIPRYVDGHIHYNGTPELMADYAVMARDAGARIVGGCCGTGPEHLRAMREALERRPRGEAPDLATVEAALGGFSSADDGSSGGGPKRERRGRRRG